MDLSAPVTAEDHVSGPADAPLELVMYGDFQCPYCAASQSILRRVRDRLDGELRFAFRHLPLADVHPLAPQAAEAAEAAAAQGQFWPFHDALYANRGALELSDLLAVAKRLGLDRGRMESELAEGLYRERVERDVASAAASGVPGTPAFFANGRRLDGAFDAGSIVEALRAPDGADEAPSAA